MLLQPVRVVLLGRGDPKSQEVMSQAHWLLCQVEARHKDVNRKSRAKSMIMQKLIASLLPMSPIALRPGNVLDPK
jgi:hypothetical protein